MFLKCLASGSSGNCYFLETDSGVLIMDCGISIMEIKRALNFNLSKVVGVVVSHNHSDHSKAVNELRDMGIPVFTPYENCKGDRARCQIGDFRINAFKLPHNDTLNYGFMVEVEGQRLLYMTDFEYCPYIFTKFKIDHMLIECNYQTKLIDREKPNFEHKVKGHCELEVCKRFIEVNKTDNLKNVILCHLGRGSVDVEEVVEEINKMAEIGVHVAVKGLQIKL